MQFNIGDLVCLKTLFTDEWNHGIGIIVELRAEWEVVPGREMFKVYWTTLRRAFWETKESIRKLPISKRGDNE